MPIPVLITDLSTTASANYPAGSDSPATLDDTARAHAAFIAQLRDGTGFAVEIPVTAGGTGRATNTTAYGLLAAGTTATGAHQTLAAGATTALLVGGGASALPVWTTATGSGAPVRASSPTLVTPALGTPSSGVATNLTGTAAGLTAGAVTTNANLTGHVTSTGNATVLGSFTSAQLKTALTDETGSGAAVFAISPTLVTPALGTPSSGTLTNCTKDGTNGLGYLNIPQNSKSAAYTCVLADAGLHLFHPSADTTARIFTIPANASVAYPIGTALTFVNQNGGGVITIAITTDTMRKADTGATGSRTLAANGIATAIKVTATEWLISGGSALT